MLRYMITSHFVQFMAPYVVLSSRPAFAPSTVSMMLPFAACLWRTELALHVSGALALVSQDWHARNWRPERPEARHEPGAAPTTLWDRPVAGSYWHSLGAVVGIPAAAYWDHTAWAALRQGNGRSQRRLG